VDFEELLSDLSAAFVSVSVDQLDNEIERWLSGSCLQWELIAARSGKSTSVTKSTM
jgi:hypothetical protein